MNPPTSASATALLAPRPLRRALQMALWCGTFTALPAWAACGLTFQTLQAPTLSVADCYLDRKITLTVSPAGSLTQMGNLDIGGAIVNQGRIRNTGQLQIAGQLNGPGRLDNTGSLIVAPRGLVVIDKSGNFEAGASVLRGGNWQVLASPSEAASLSLGLSKGWRNEADLLISGRGAILTQLDQLRSNAGSLTLADGYSVQLGKLANSGMLAVTSGAELRLTESASLDSGWLKEGYWVVDNTGSASPKGGATLYLGSGITRNSATILLSGSGASFEGLSTLSVNDGILGAASGQQLTLAALYNTGTVTAADGGRVDLVTSKNLTNKTLTGGTWRIEGQGQLAVGSGNILTNAATVVISGAGARFSQFGKLGRNEGWLRIEDGASFIAAQGLTNAVRGLLETASGGSFNVPAGQQLYNEGEVFNAGQLIVAGKAQGPGTLDNSGSLVVQGGDVRIENSPNLAGGKLSGGRWRVEGGGILGLGDGGDILVNGATVELSGTRASFAQLGGLIENTGSLTITDGRTTTLARLHNTGTLTASAGGQVILNRSDNVVKGTLTGGAWVVDGPAASNAISAMSVGIGDISRNQADITLSGANSRWTQLDNLTENRGTLTVTEGRNLSLSRLDNEGGSLRVGPGSEVVLGASGSRLAGVLRNGTWEVLAEPGRTASLRIGSGLIQSNAATVLLSGEASAFNQLDDLRINTGTLTVAQGRSFSTSRISDFTSTGTVAVLSGAQFTIPKHSLINGAGVLQAGRWVIDGRSGAPTRLDFVNEVGFNAIGSNVALTLRGEQAEVVHLGGWLRRVNGPDGLSGPGSLSLLDGHSLVLYRYDDPRAPRSTTFEQLGHLVIGAGSSLRWADGVAGRFVQNGDSQSRTQVDGLLTAQNLSVSAGRFVGNGVIAAAEMSFGPNSIFWPGLPDDLTDAPDNSLLAVGSVKVQGRVLFQLFEPRDFNTLQVHGSLALQDAWILFKLGFYPTAPSYSFAVVQYDELLPGSSWRHGFDMGGYQAAGYDTAFGCSAGACTLTLTAAVPEPERYALLLGGLGVLAWARRRQRPA